MKAILEMEAPRCCRECCLACVNYEPHWVECVLLHMNENNVDSDVTAYCTYDNIQNDRRHPGCPLKIVEDKKEDFTLKKLEELIIKISRSISQPLSEEEIKALINGAVPADCNLCDEQCQEPIIIEDTKEAAHD